MLKQFNFLKDNYNFQTILTKNFNLNMLNALLESEYQFCIEKYNYNKNNFTVLTFHPSCILSQEMSTFNLGTINNNFKFIYEIKLEKPSFLPVSLKNINVFEGLNVFSQMLFKKKTNNWRGNAKEQYFDWLSGNENPSNLQILRNFQNEVIYLLKQQKNKKRKEEIESKIKDDCYRFEWRILVEDNKDMWIVEERLKKFDFYNFFKIEEIDNSALKDISYRKFSLDTFYQFLSRKEIYCITDVKTDENNDFYFDEKKESTIKNLENSSISTNSLIQLLPNAIEYTKEINYKIIDDITSALKRVKILTSRQTLQNVIIQQGTTLQKITFNIPDKINFSAIEKTAKDLKALLGLESLAIEQGKDAGTISFVTPSNIREIVYLRKLLESKEFNEFSNKSAVPFVFGTDEIGDPLFADLSKLKHVMISGATGSGKSFWIIMFLLTLIILNSDKELELYLIDPKMVEFSLFKGFPHVKEIVTDMRQSVILLNKIVNIMEKRYSIFAEHNCRDIFAYRNKIGSMSTIVCAIDEYADLMMTNPQVEDYIVRLGQKARAAGIHLVLATQRPEAKIVTGLIKANIPTKIAFRMESSTDYKTIFGKTIPYSLMGNGDGVIRMEGQQKEFQRFQGAVITLNDMELEKTFDNLKKMYQNNFDFNKYHITNESKQDEIEEVEQKQELSDLEKLKVIIAKTGETRVSYLQKKMGIRINTVTELMRMLVEENWLERPASKAKGYSLIATEEQMKEWREYSL